MEAFIDWIRKRDAYISEVIIKKCPDNSGYGVYAKRVFRENEILISIPLEVLITARGLAEIPVYEQLFTGKGLRPFEALIVFFISECRKENKSEWAPYLKMLPRTFTTPAVIDRDLSADNLPVSERELWIDQQRELDVMYTKVGKVLAESLDYELFLWAWHIVNTRCIYVPSNPHSLFDNSEGDSVAVIPFIDMLNHSNEYQGFCEWNNVMQRYVVTAARTICEGDQIFVCYGPHSNGRLWIDYGFTMPNNLCNKIPVNLAAESGIKFTEAHKQAVRDAKLSCTLYSSDDTPSYGFRAAFRILQLDFDQLGKWSYYVYNNDDDDKNGKHLKLAIQNLYRHYVSKRDRVPKRHHWLWNEYIAILDHYIKNL